MLPLEMDTKVRMKKVLYLVQEGQAKTSGNLKKNLSLLKKSGLNIKHFTLLVSVINQSNSFIFPDSLSLCSHPPLPALFVCLY